MYGALFHIRNKNPFNLEVLVDAWPEYQTVVIRPQKEVRPRLLSVGPLTLRTGMRGCSEGPAGGTDLATPDSCRCGKGRWDERAGW